VLAVVLFAGALGVHIWLLLRLRNWYFSTMVVGTFMEVIGYIFRTLSSKQDPYSIPWFVIQYFYIVVAPVLFSAAIYTIASLLIRRYGSKYIPISPKLVLWIFISCDVGATILQVTGAALVGSSYPKNRDPTPYNNILLAGLAIQVFSFALFLAILAYIFWKARSSPVKVHKNFLGAFVIATLAVYLRTCFRLAETAEGLMQTLSTHEAYFGALEFAPVVVAVWIFTYWNPGRWLKGPMLMEKVSNGGEGGDSHSSRALGQLHSM